MMPMTDINNRPGGPNLIVTAKTAHMVHVLDAETLTLQATSDMPGSNQDLALDTAHSVAVNHATGNIFASVKSNYLVAIARARREVIDRVALPHVLEGLAVSSDGLAVYSCAQDAAEFYAIDVNSHAIRNVVP